MNSTAFGISTGVSISVTESIFSIFIIHRFHEASFVDPLTGLVQSSRPSCGCGKHNHFTLHLSGDRGWQQVPQCCIAFTRGEMNVCGLLGASVKTRISSSSVVIPPATTPLRSFPSELSYGQSCRFFHRKSPVSQIKDKIIVDLKCFFVTCILCI